MKVGDRVVIVDGWVARESGKVLSGEITHIGSTDISILFDEKTQVGRLKFEAVYVYPKDVIPEALYKSKLFNILK